MGMSDNVPSGHVKLTAALFSFTKDIQGSVILD